MPRIVATLGPTNTGKTYRAIERMLDFETGMIGLPLRLLAREVYDRVTARVGRDKTALVTGEEKRVPKTAAYWICTVEAMPVSRAVDFLAVDEIQLAAHAQRGHVFTDRLLHARGEKETWFLGSDTMRDVIAELVPTAELLSHPRLSQLTFTGKAPLSRLKPKSAVVAFSVAEVYDIAERLRVQKGGAAVVLGALSPHTRNAQVAMFQAGEIDYLVATDAIGMGLNLDLHHVSFAALEKFDGKKVRHLETAELGQIAGRAGRHLQDGSFGTVEPVELQRWAAQEVEAQRFPTVSHVFWRAHELDFSDADALIASLRSPSKRRVLVPIAEAEDAAAFRWLAAQEDVRARLNDEASVRLLWDVACVPDFRKLLFESHVEILKEIFVALCEGPLSDVWMTARIDALSDTSGDVDTLIFRISSLRTWAYVAQHREWVRDGVSLAEKTIALEDKLSDALHTALVARFVSKQGRRRESKKGAKKAAPVTAAPKVDAAHPFAGLAGLRQELALRDAKVIAVEHYEALIDAPHETFVIDAKAMVTFELNGERRVLGRLVRGKTVLLPDAELVGAEELGAGLQSRLKKRLVAFARDLVTRFLSPIAPLEHADSAAVRGLAYDLKNGLGTAAPRPLTERDREILRRFDVVVGKRNIEAQALQSPAAVVTRKILQQAFKSAARRR